MQFYSTKNHQFRVSFREAVLNGIAPDGGLYLPADLPVQRSSYIDSLKNLSFREISYDIAKIFVDSMSANDLHSIIEKTITFDAPLIPLSDQFSVLELFHGPTLAFKDFGARFLANTMSVLTREEDKNIVILVATSGDTGSAVAHGFYDNERIKVALLYPSGKVSNIQEQQLTTLKKNIQAFEIKGTFDDCQRLVKTAFLDSQLKKKYLLSSANSINIARLIPQSFYYFNAYARSLKRHRGSIIFSVPCGNFGNLTAGIMAKKLGLPVEKFIASVNENDVFEHYLKTGEYIPKKAVKTLANAMDVGNPSNFDRIINLFDNDRAAILKNVESHSISDDRIEEGIREVYQTFGYLIDPHGAVGYQALKEIKHRSLSKCHYIILGTAHPAKFLDIVSPIININIDIPSRLKDCLNKPKNSIPVSDDYSEFKSKLIQWLK
jgi:threonine synthase